MPIHFSPTPTFRPAAPSAASRAGAEPDTDSRLTEEQVAHEAAEVRQAQEDIDAVEEFRHDLSANIQQSLARRRAAAQARQAQVLSPFFDVAPETPNAGAMGAGSVIAPPARSVRDAAVELMRTREDRRQELLQPTAQDDIRSPRQA